MIIAAEVLKDEGDKLVPAFKNATYWSNEDHWEWATNPNEREKASFSKRKYFTDTRKAGN